MRGETLYLDDVVKMTPSTTQPTQPLALQLHLQHPAFKL
eukprot:SAG11_NODE_11401_length_763_cov_0.914157_2_plen_38_part_01